MKISTYTLLLLNKVLTFEEKNAEHKQTFFFYFLDELYKTDSLTASIEALSLHLVVNRGITVLYYFMAHIGPLTVFTVSVCRNEEPTNTKLIVPFLPPQIVDTLFIGRYVLLAVTSAVFLVMFFMLLPFHFLEPVYAKALRTQ